MSFSKNTKGYNLRSEQALIGKQRQRNGIAKRDHDTEHELVPRAGGEDASRSARLRQALEGLLVRARNKRDRALKAERLRARREKLRDWTGDRARAMLTQTAEQMLERCARALDRWPKDPYLRGRIDSLMGVSGHGAPDNVLASNVHLRKRVLEWLIPRLEAMQAEHPDRRFYHATFIDSAMATRDRQTEIAFTPFERRIRALLRQVGIADWFGVFEIQGWVNGELDLGRVIDPHAHVMFWTDQPMRREELQNLETRLRASKRLTSLSGAHTVVVKEWRPAAGSVAGLLYYLMMLPERGKNRMASRVRPGEFVSRDAELRPSLALRLMEILSSFELKELIFSSGAEGTAIRRGVATLIHGFATQEGADLIDRPTAAEIWREARASAGENRYESVQVTPRPMQNRTRIERISSRERLRMPERSRRKAPRSIGRAANRRRQR